MATPSTLVLEKALALLTRIVSAERPRSLADLAAELGLPLSSAHRLVVTLQRQGFVSRAGRGAYLPGPALIRLGGRRSLSSVLKQVAEPVLAALARRTGLTAHLGVLENDMVTYLVKAAGAAPVPTRTDMQLEAYCSGIGKVLLAYLPPDERARYLGSGPFPALTPRTITQPAELMAELDQVRSRGFAVDDQEFAPDLSCLAAPVRSDHEQVCAAISLSAPLPDPCRLGVAERLELLELAALKVRRRLNPLA